MSAIDEYLKEIDLLVSRHSCSKDEVLDLHHELVSNPYSNGFSILSLLETGCGLIDQGYSAEQVVKFLNGFVGTPSMSKQVLPDPPKNTYRNNLRLIRED